MQTQSTPVNAKQVFALNNVSFQAAPRPYEGGLKKKMVVKLRVMQGTKFVETIHARITHTGSKELIGYVLSDTWCPKKHGIAQGASITFEPCQVWCAWDNVSFHGEKYYFANNQ